MTSELRVDNLKGSTTGGSINVLGEGTSATTNLQQGLAKAWVNFDCTASGAAARDSFNVSGMTDHGTGDHEVNYSNSMNNDDYAHPFHFGGTSGQGMLRTGGRGVNTGKIGVVGTNGAQDTGQDVTASGVAVFGDLA